MRTLTQYQGELGLALRDRRESAVSLLDSPRCTSCARALGRAQRLELGAEFSRVSAGSQREGLLLPGLMEGWVSLATGLSIFVSIRLLLSIPRGCCIHVRWLRGDTLCQGVEVNSPVHGVMVCSCRFRRWNRF